jgi:hypothetical protein
VKDKLEQYAVKQHTEPVSSKSPQKELDLSPPNSGLFFRPLFRAAAIAPFRRRA